jgi:EmrB/QacA subfamily drug resistance transporter
MSGKAAAMCGQGLGGKLTVLPSLPRKDLLVSSLQRWTLIVVCAATAILMLDIAVVNTALATIADDLHTGLGGLQWVVDGYTLALAAIVLTAGSLADRFGRRRAFALGLVAFTAASAACAAAGSIEFLNTARAVQGLGAAVLFATSLALLADAFPGERERAGALAGYGATIAASFAIGPAVGGALTTGLGWRWVFLVNLPIGIAGVVIAVKKVAESKDPFPRSLDYPGQAAIVGALFLLVLALLRGNEQGWGSTPIVAELAGAAALFAAFIAIERRAREPMLPLGLFRIRMFTGAQLAVFSISASFFAVFLYATLYLQNVLGLSAIEAGLVYLPGTAIMLFVSGATAQLTAKFHPGALISGGLVLVAIGMAMLTVADVDSSWVVVLPGTIVALIGTGLFNPAVSMVALSSAPPEQSGLAAGVNDTFRQAGIAVGVAALGALIPQDVLSGGSPVEYVDGLRVALLAGAGLAAAGAIAGGLLIRRRAAMVPAVADSPVTA